MLRAGGTLCALVLGLSSAVRLAHAASEDRVPTADSSGGALASALAQQATAGSVTADAAVLQQWHADMRQIPTSGEGCFHASYPNYVWEKIDCQSSSNLVHSRQTKIAVGATDMTGAGVTSYAVGNGHDYVIQSRGLIGMAIGQLTTKGVTGETGVGVPYYGDGGTLGPNEYSIQLNTNSNRSTRACAGRSGCTVFQQFVYTSDGEPVVGVSGVNGGLVLMEYILINYWPTSHTGPGSCPIGWVAAISQCYRFSEKFVKVPQIPASDLGKITLAATAMSGENDVLYFGYGADAYSLVQSDSMVDIASVWDQVEFNVVGNAGGSRAEFNSGSSITVDVTLLDGGAGAKCVLVNNKNDRSPGSGTTEESNNLNLKSCSIIHGGLVPTVQFTESN